MSIEENTRIAQLGNPILKRRADEIVDAADDCIQQLIRDMIDTLKQSKGVGLAAPQIFEAIRLIIIASHPNERYPDAPSMTPTAMINPQILSLSDETETDWEGCLSAPGLRGLVPRARSVQLKYISKDGHEVVKIFSGFVARIIQHEIDHLDGISFLERVSDIRDVATEKEFVRIIKNSQQSS